MKLFNCLHCGQLLYFENSRCEKCGYLLGFFSTELVLYPLVNNEDDTFNLYNGNTKNRYRYCTNHFYGVCNWIIPSGNDSPYCEACQLNHIIPDLSLPEFRQRWNKIEAAKHRLIYSILRLKLPIINKNQDAQKGLSFDFIADEKQGERRRILTGHSDGLITLNIEEADDVDREQARKAMDEVYRTLLGHFRHEIGHYYWDRLIDNTTYLNKFRQLFGDERKDYVKSLQEHYEKGPAANWRNDYISAYASTHPWEDWAETWAHYMHILDTLETAHAFGLSVHPATASDLKATLNFDPYEQKNFDTIIQHWLPLTFAMNSLNRGMGLSDLYPFIITEKVQDKLAFIHDVCFTEK